LTRTALALGLGLGLTAQKGVGWRESGSAFDADFENSRFHFGGANYTSVGSFLAAIGGTEAAGAIAIGPYAIPDAPEHVVNGDFADGTTGWAGHRGGTISVVGGVCVLEGNGGNIPGFAQAVTLQKGHAYQFRGRQRRSTTDVTPSWTVASASDLGGVSGCHLPSSGTVMNTVESTFSADAATMYVGGRTVLNPSTGTSEYDDATIREVLPFDGFVQEGFAAIIAGTTPATASGEKVVFEASCGGIDNVSPHERNRVRLHWDAAGHLHLVVTAKNAEVANLDLGEVAPETAFKVLLSVASNAFRASLDGGPVLSDTAGDLPGIARLYLKRQNAAGSVFDGTLSRVTVFPEAWSAQEFAGRTKGIRTEGDSFMGGAYSISLPNTLEALIGREVYNTGAGSSTMEGIRDRILLEANAPLRGLTTVFWDGSENGLTTVDAYLDQLQEALSALGHGRYIIIPPCYNSGQNSNVTRDAVAAAMQVRWPDKYLDWRGVLTGNGSGGLDDTMYAQLPGDTTHLSQAAFDLMAVEVAEFITTRGW
jgi:hypothetical protein